MKNVLIALCLLSTPALAAEVCPLKKPKKASPCAKAVKKPASAPKPVVVMTPAPTPSEPCCDKKGDVVNTNTNTNSFNIHVGGQATQQPARVKIVERVRIKTEYRKVTDSDPNRVLLLAGIAKTGYSVHKDSCCNITVDKKHQFDVGAMYIRDFGALSIGAAATFRSNFYLAGGINF